METPEGRQGLAEEQNRSVPLFQPLCLAKRHRVHTTWHQPLERFSGSFTATEFSFRRNFKVS